MPDDPLVPHSPDDALIFCDARRGSDIASSGLSEIAAGGDGEAWLAENSMAIGQRSTFDLQATLPAGFNLAYKIGLGAGMLLRRSRQAAKVQHGSTV
jgi:hypothetical protein